MTRSEWRNAYREARKVVRFWMTFPRSLPEPPSILLEIPHCARACAFRWGDMLKFRTYRQPGGPLRSRVSGRALGRE